MTTDLPVFEFAFPGPLRDKLVAAVLDGTKTATTGLLQDYEIDGEPLPVVGTRAAVVDSTDRRVAVIEVTEVRLIRLGDVDVDHARSEGEGDDSVAAWRAGHEDYWHGTDYRRWLGNQDFTVDDDTPVVLERFRLVEVLRPSHVNDRLAHRSEGSGRIPAGSPRRSRRSEPVHIRVARDSDLTVMQDIERAAGAYFRDIGMPEIADDDPLPISDLARYQRAGTAWVAADSTNAPIAYLIAEVVDGNLHIEQVSVDPRHARRGVGRRLLDHAAEYAGASHIPALTLTTFAHVPWNAPYYTRCGFRALTVAELTPGLQAIRRQEAAHGLDRWARVCMRRTL